MSDSGNVETVPAKSESRLLAAVESIVQALAWTTTLDETLAAALTTCVQLLDAEGGTIYEHDPRDRVLRFRHVVPSELRDLLPTLALEDHRGIAGAVFQSGQTRIDTEVANAPEHDKRIDEYTGVVTRTMITAPLLIRGDKPVGIVQLVNKRCGVFGEADQDVIEIVATVAALSIHNRQLARQAQKSARLSAMGDIAHDIKNKVSPLTMSVELIRRAVHDMRRTAGNASDTDAQARLDKLLDCQKEAVQQVYRYTKLLADVSRGRSLEPQWRRGDLGETVRREARRHESEARQVGIECYYAIESLPWTFDELMIERLVANLVQNAVQATPRGGKLSVAVDREDGEAVITVADTGRGMSPEHLRDLLYGEAASDRSGGTGLGNRICREIVDAHGGKLEGFSAPGAGTCLKVRLPPIDPAC